MEYNEIIRTSVSGVFSSIYLIDIINDKVLEYDYNYNLLNTNNFYNYVEKTKMEIHPDSLTEFFDAISLKKLEEEILKGNSQVIYKYPKRINGNYKDYLSIIKLVNNNNSNFVLILDVEATLENKIGSDNKSYEEKLEQVSDRVSDVILKIYNTLDSLNNVTDQNQVVHANTYISNILNNLVRDIPELNKNLEHQMISQVNKKRQSLMIIDDDLMTRNLIKKAFSEDYEIIMATNGQEALNILEDNKNKNNIDIRDNIVGIFLDLAMPVLDGFAVLEYLKLNNILGKIPVIIISAAEEKSTRQRVYQYGIADMLEKPFNLEIIKYRTNNLIDLYKTSNSLNELILRKHDDLTDYIELLIGSYLYDNKDSINYIKQITKLLLNKIISSFPQYRIMTGQIDKIVEASQYYDIGTYFTPKDNNNEGYYNHPIVGSEVINKVLVTKLDGDILNYSYEICRFHHEKFDGTGFPSKMSNEQIPIFVQVVSLAIEYTKMLLSGRGNNDIYNTIVRKENTKYNPNLITCFKMSAKELTEIKK